MKILKSIALLFVFSLLGGCSERAGGPCNYEPHAGIAEVVSINESGYQLKFALLPEPNMAMHTKAYIPLERLNGWVFDVSSRYPGLKGAVVGSRFYTKVSLITEGSCTPDSIEIGAPVQESQAEIVTPNRSADVKGQNGMRCAVIENNNMPSRLCAVKLKSGLTEWRLGTAGKPAQIIGATGGMAQSLPDFEFDRERQYIAVVTAEEGHPMLAVYDLRTWIKNSQQPEALFVINPYPGSFYLTGWENNAASAAQPGGSRGLLFLSDGPVLSTDDQRVVKFPLPVMLNYRVSFPEGRIERGR